MGMTLEEAIKYYSELAEENEKDAEQFKRIKATQDMISHCYECAKEHRQLAEWLRKLKALKDFANFVAENVMEDDFEENGSFYAEVFGRRLNKLGVIRSENNKWVYDEEVNADEDSD